MTTQKDLRFVALGDSTTVGIGDPVCGGGWRGWARLLADQLALRYRLSYINLAVPGATATAVTATQLPQALRHEPQLASVIVGINDTMRSTWDAGRVRDEVQTCVGALAEAGAVVMTLRFHDHGAVLGLFGALRRAMWRRIEALNAAYDTAHALFGGVRIDLTANPVVYQRTFWSIDRLHPSELGHRRLAAEFAIQLRAHGLPVTVPAPGCSRPPGRWQDYWWLASQGLPWAGRRAHDLVPWAVRLALTEASARSRPRAGAGRRWDTEADNGHAPAGHVDITVGSPPDATLGACASRSSPNRSCRRSTASPTQCATSSSNSPPVGMR